MNKVIGKKVTELSLELRLLLLNSTVKILVFFFLNLQCVNNLLENAVMPHFLKEGKIRTWQMEHHNSSI